MWAADERRPERKRVGNLDYKGLYGGGKLSGNVIRVALLRIRHFTGRGERY